MRASLRDLALRPRARRLGYSEDLKWEEVYRTFKNTRCERLPGNQSFAAMNTAELVSVRPPPAAHAILTQLKAGDTYIRARLANYQKHTKIHDELLKTL